MRKSQPPVRTLAGLGLADLFLPETKLMGVYCLQQFIQLLVFSFCCLRVQNILSVLLCLLVTPNFMFAMFAAWSTLNLKCHVCVPRRHTDFQIPWASLLQDTVFQVLCSYFLSCCDFQGLYFCLLQRALIFKCLASLYRCTVHLDTNVSFCTTHCIHTTIDLT